MAGAALAASWNPLGAPFALVAGILVSVMAIQRLFAGGRRRLAAAALALGVGAAVASVMVLLATVGLGLRPEEKLAVEPRNPSEARKALDDAAARSQEARARAAKELEQLPPPEQARPPPGRAPAGAR